MEKHFKFCSQCRRTITEREFARGLFVESENGLVCATCAQKMDEQEILNLIGDNPAPAADVDPAEVDAAAERPDDVQISHLSGIQEQLERIHRVIMFEKSSAWNVVAAVVQCLAIMLLIAAAFRWLEKPIELIVVALTFQVMALTFFVKGK